MCAEHRQQRVNHLHLTTHTHTHTERVNHLHLTTHTHTHTERVNHLHLTTHTHARTHAHTHVRTRTHTHTQTHSKTHCANVSCPPNKTDRLGDVPPSQSLYFLTEFSSVLNKLNPTQQIKQNNKATEPTIDIRQTEQIHRVAQNLHFFPYTISLESFKTK